MLPDGTLYILALNGVICLSGVLLCVLVMIRERRLLLMPMGLAFFLVTNGLTQGAPLWIDLGVNFPTDPIIYQRATAIDAIILTIALPGMFVMDGVRWRYPAQARYPWKLSSGSSALCGKEERSLDSSQIVRWASHFWRLSRLSLRAPAGIF